MRSWEERTEVVLDLLYRAAADPAAWQDFLASTAQVFEACTVCLLARSSAGPEYSVGASVGLSDHAIQLYNEYYASVDPWYLSLRKQRTEQWIGLGSDLCTPLDFGNSEFYYDYLKKEAAGWHQAGIVDLCSGSVLTLHRTRRLRDFGKRDVRFLHRLLPHVRRALAIHQKFVQLSGSLAQVDHALDALDIALIGLGPDRRICFTNLRGEALLRSGDVLIARNGRVISRDSCIQDRLDELLADTNRPPGTRVGGAVVVPNAGRRLIISVLPSRHSFSAIPLEATILLLIVDPSSRPAARERLLSVLYALTPAEARVVMLLLRGMDPNEIARQTHNTPGTVRFQLKMVYSKTGVKRQSQLVRLVSQLPGTIE